ncbi:hypothetical protein IPH92_01585 [Candidatus Kaiserbacteria bacterium]|nr:MAG: hypothetical protein IPH92_01585 [Candidatus Kaiserbacteria bacterium]
MERRAMKQRYIMIGAHKEMRGLEYLVYSAFSLVLLVVLVFLPLAPVFADEVVMDNGELVLRDQDTEVEQEEVGITDVVDIADDALEVSDTEEVPLTPIEASIVTEGTENVTNGSILEEPEATPVFVIEEVTESSSEPLLEETINSLYEEVIEDTTKQLSEAATEEKAESLPKTPIEVTVDEVLSERGSTTEEVVEIETPQEEVIPKVTLPEEVLPLEDVTPDPENIGEEVSATLETTSSTTMEEPIVHVVTNDENKFSFSKDECTTVGDGSFYCATSKDAPRVQNNDRIFSAVDAEGDKEIYAEKNAELVTLTDNQLDDEAPYFDEVSNTAVWHRLIDGRYQIIQFDFETGEETQLTDDRYNNMQPSVFGDAVVWQGWVGNDWEIFLETDGERTMLTDNTTHDIAPSVNGTHVVWQSFEEDAWRMQVYDMRSGATHTIEDADGGSIENPRFVLVYDAKMDTGDIETRGYDLKSGEVLNLASRPTPVPEEIPNPEQTGEERALVAPVTQPKPKTDSDENDDVGTTTDDGLDEGDLVIPVFTEDESSSSTPEVAVEVSDVVIPSFSEGTTTDEVISIEDLVVEPYVPLEDVLNEEIKI